MKLIILSAVLSVTAFAADLPVKRLVDHFNNEGIIGRKEGRKKRANEFRGYLVSIQAASLVYKNDKFYVYESTVGISTGVMAVLLKRSPQLDPEFERAFVAEQKILTNARRVAQEGGGDGLLFSPNKGKVQMFVIGKPAGFENYLHPDGSIDRAMAFNVEQVCEYDFKNCRKIRDSAEPVGFFSKLLGG